MLKIKTLVFLLAGFLSFLQPYTCSAGLLVEYKMQTNKANEIIDCTHNDRNGKLTGNAEIVIENGRRILSLKGKGGVDILNSEGINATDNLTYVAIVKFKKTMGDSKAANGRDAIFYKHKQFVMSRRLEKFYCNFKDNNDWVGSMVSALTVKLNRWYHLALSFNYHNVPSQGEIWTTTKLYVNGRCVASKTVPYARPGKNKNVLQLGQANGFGDVWFFNGDIAYAAVYSKTLKKQEIQKLVLAEKLVKPDFSIPRKLTDKQQETILELHTIVAKKNKHQKQIARALIDSVKNIALTNSCNLDFDHSSQLLKNIFIKSTSSENMLKKWNENNQIQTLSTKAAVLSVALDRKTKKFYLLGLNDLKTSREIFQSNSKIWKCNIKINNKIYSFNSLSNGLKAKYFKEISQNRNGEWEFSILWEKSKTTKNPAEFTALSNFVFKDGRLSYDLKVESSQEGSIVKQVTFPCVSIKDFASNNARLLVPTMSGVEQPKPLQAGYSYSGYYPSGSCSMQLGAYYDDKSGVYFATEDPFGSSKSVFFLTSSYGIDINYVWNNGSNLFNSRSNAVFEIFRGNWYDAGLIYRKWVTKLNPVWWTKELPRKGTPKWFRDNTLWFRMPDRDKSNQVAWLKQIREYVDLPFAVHWYSWWGDFDRDYPHYFPNPKNYDILQNLKSTGIRVVPYTNGQLWETKDRREEDWQFSTIGIPNCVKEEDGKPCIERYCGASFGVMCPASKPWQKIVYELALNLPAFGFDGIYFDQVAAAKPHFCYDKSHGHLLGDHNTWFMKGYYPMYTKIRMALKRKSPNVILTSEDVSETYSKIFDGMLPWRWMYNGQVPLFPLVYSGRTQFVGLYFGTEVAPARFPMLASQLVNSEQLGWFDVNAFRNVFSKDLRAFVKRLMHVRYALLDYFNQGTLGRPITFKSPMASFTHKWGCFGTGYVTNPAIISSAWCFNKTTAFIMINTTSKKQIQKVAFASKDLPVSTQRLQLHSFNTVTGHRKSLQSMPFTQEIELKPYATEVWVVADSEQDISQILNRVKKTFKKIIGFANEKDPFSK